ncbi:hypothetical protein NSZ01_39360 [Nocardioides szechwanensis]|uniref:Uncharacterized protein n=1 Tax=Nocardioides szechwanensis TaxID=1005944 RepID=A0A1H0LEX0_9ACTN|nr:hypothetical protein [Nocardioides szechwanensis]GEP36168.1 hypothetical protein NSZ01_39360 [Nocardioides szechwanensis]SDO66551.1 hypothetical protein SAMN05192576_0224 [Nocardioides szechwanensis]
MTFELLSALTPWLVGFAAVVVIGLALAVVGVTDFVASNRKVRVARHESIRTYYGRLTLSH